MFFDSDIYKIALKYKETMPKRLPVEELKIVNEYIKRYNQEQVQISNTRQLLFNVLNNITYPPACKVCGKSVSWLTGKRKYATYCSIQCQHKDPIVREKASVSIKLVTPVSTEKRKKTNIKKYGHSNFLASEVGKTKTHDALKSIHGVDNVSQIPEVQKKKRENSITKYGVDHPSKTANVKQKIVDTNIKRYGKGSWAQQHLSDTTLCMLNDKDWLYEQHITNQKTLAEISLLCENIDPTTISRYLLKSGIPIQYYTNFFSHYEIEILEYIKGLGIENIKHNDRTLIAPHEVDILIPDHKIAIEFCGVYWHGDWRLPRDYHLIKHNKVTDAGYYLMTIFEDEWVSRKNIIKTIIKHKLGLSDQEKVDARKCSVVAVTEPQTKREFFNKNHIQGDGPGSITMGLCRSGSGELCAMITFIAQKNHYILNRYATNANVRGGFTKLIKAFQQQHNTSNKRIITFADKRYSSGELYTNSGFRYVGDLKPTYSYVLNKKRHHRFQFRKKYLQNNLKNYDATKTEFQNCDDNGIVRIWDCGLHKFELMK